MREILFRGRTTAGKEWVSGFYAVFSATPFIGAHNSYGTMLWFEVDPETVGQFTGLTDKDGKKIFEGDIVKAPFCDKKLYTFAIQFINGGFYAVPAGGTIDALRPWKYHLNGANNQMVVVGNIHDNPELLEGGVANAT